MNEIFSTNWREGRYNVRRSRSAEASKAQQRLVIEPLSAWQTDFVPPAPPEPETLKKDDAESLLRRLITDNAPGMRNARYILALMLERKKVVRQIERQRQDDVSILVYEHIPSSEVWLIEDPGLKLGELSAVQEEVAHLLTHGPDESTPSPAEAPEAAASA